MVCTPLTTIAAQNVLIKVSYLEETSQFPSYSKHLGAVPTHIWFLLCPFSSCMQDLCHSHSDEATIQQKISTIINCFINSSMPPALQIDIPAEQAQHILEKRHELGPYIFREAQVCGVRI